MSISPPQSSAQCPVCSASLSPFFTFCPSCGCELSRPIREPTGSTDASTASGISIQRNGQVFGPYPRDVVEQWIASGQVQKHDLGCRDLVEGWQPLGKLLWPEQFAKAGTFSGKQWAWIVGTIVAFVALGTLVNNLDANKGTSSTSSLQTSTPGAVIALTDFERGEKYFKEGSHFAANEAFQKVGQTDPHYKEAQARLQVTKQKVAEYQQLEKKKDAVRSRYEKLCHNGLYLFQIEERLQRDNFHMETSGFEKAPDCSTGVRQHFAKTTDEGIAIRIWLQNGYSMSAYYCNVEVQ